MAALLVAQLRAVGRSHRSLLCAGLEQQHGIEPPGALLRFLGQIPARRQSLRQISVRLRYACPVCFQRMLRAPAGSTAYAPVCNGKLQPVIPSDQERQGLRELLAEQGIEQ